jgi:hypothetical protein
VAPEIRDLDDAGSAAADLLIDSFFEVQLLEQVRAGYEEACRNTLGRLSVDPRHLGLDDFRRMLFEVAVPRQCPMGTPGSWNN